MSRDFQNSNRVTEWTDELQIIPNSWGFIESLGLFTPNPISQYTFTFDETFRTNVLLLDSPRGERSKYGRRDGRNTHAVPVPQFTFDDAIFPEDVAGVRRDGDPNAPTSLDIERMKVMRRARESWANTMEFARAQALQGTVYAPNQTVDINWYNEFGVTQKTVNFNLGVATTDVTAKCEETVAHIQDNLKNGGMAGTIIALCSPEFFSDLIKHENVKEAYLYYRSENQSGGNQLLRDRLTTTLADSRFRAFDHQGILFVEYRGSFEKQDGTFAKIIPAGEAYAFPTNVTGMYQTIYSPAHRLSTANTIAEEMYMLEKLIDDKQWLYETDSSFLNIVRRPAAVVKLTNT